MPSTWGQRQQYGEFRIVGAADGRPKLLGEGIFGKTFEAVRFDTAAGNVNGDRVALKVLNPELLNSESKRAQFVQDHTVHTRQKHANLVHSIKCGEDNGEIYIAMELCRGGDIARLVDRFGALPERVAALIGHQAATGLREIHRRGMIHWDIKPQNIILSESLPSDCTLDDFTLMLEQNDSLCRIVDFGLVGNIINAQGNYGPAAPQKFIGSLMYASPEQILEQKYIDGRTDIYALGMTLWYLVQGRGPLLSAQGDELDHPTEAEGRHLSGTEHEPSLPNKLSQEFRAILARMVAKRREERLPHMKELANALEHYLEQPATPPPNEPSRVQSRERLQSFYGFQVASLTNIGRQRIAAEHCSTKQKVRLTIVEDLKHIGRIRSDLNDVVDKVFAMSHALRKPGVPVTLLHVYEVIWAANALAYAEDVPGDVTLAEVLQARTASHQPFSLYEAEVIFRPIAETLDYLCNQGWSFISLPCEDVWLSDAVVAASPRDRKALCRPLTNWEGLRVKFSGMWVPPERRKEESLAEITVGSVQYSSSLRHPVSAFLRLIYRTISGSDLPDAADRWANGYISSASLQAASNNLIRDLLCKNRQWTTSTAALDELCANEGVLVSSSILRESLPSVNAPGSEVPIATIVSAAKRVVRSPHAMHETQSIPKAKWKPGMKIRCWETDGFFRLPDELPSIQGVKIAISYRRLDSKPVVMRFYDDVLIPKFSEPDVFIDLDKIAPGEDFRRRILNAFQESAVVLVFIGRQWLGVGLGVGGKPRLHEEGDFVRLEVAQALELGCTIIPVLIDHTPMPSADELPPEIRGISNLQAFELDSGIRWKKDSAALGEEIKRLLADSGDSA